MQPTLRQVPPRSGLPEAEPDCSMQAVLKPNWAQRIAAT